MAQKGKKQKMQVCYQAGMALNCKSITNICFTIF